MAAGLGGAGGDLLGDGEDEVLAGLLDGPGAGRVLAGAVGDGGQATVAGQHLGALHTGGLHGAGLDDSEGVAAMGC